MTRTRWSQIVCCAALVLAGCAGDDPGDPQSCEGSAILGGSATPGSIAYDAAVKATLASVVIDLGAGEIGLCSGVMLSQRALLTARHCVDATGGASAPAAPAALTVFLGDPLDVAAPKAAVAEIARHDALDVALLSVDFHGRASGAAPVPLLEGALDDGWVGAEVELAGYGVGDDGDAGILTFATEAIAALEADHVVVTGQGESGACVGDSGGPLFGTTRDGRVRVLGLLDDGADSCLGQDRYTRVDRLRDWAPLTSALAAGCAR
jgi:hypothetical protein